MAKLTMETVITWLSRGLLLVIAALYLIMGVFQKCTGEEWLSCKITGSFFDWVGSITFLAGVVFLSGLIVPLNNYVNRLRIGPSINVIMFVIAVLSIVLVWNL